MPACRRCGVEQPEENFYRNKRYKDGVVLSWCKSCFKEWHRQRYTGQAEASDEPRPCSWCESIYTPAVRCVSYYCSDLCRRRSRCAADKKALEASKPVDRSCPHCGSLLPQKMRSNAVFCSAACNQKAHNAARTSARRSLTPQPKQIQVRAMIANRCKWVCALCHLPVDPAKAWPDPTYGSIDHRVPLAKGGSITEENLQLAHLFCNLQKGTKI